MLKKKLFVRKWATAVMYLLATQLSEVCWNAPQYEML